MQFIVVVLLSTATGVFLSKGTNNAALGLSSAFALLTLNEIFQAKK